MTLDSISVFFMLRRFSWPISVQFFSGRHAQILRSQLKWKSNVDELLLNSRSMSSELKPTGTRVADMVDRLYKASDCKDHYQPVRIASRAKKQAKDPAKKPPTLQELQSIHSADVPHTAEDIRDYLPFLWKQYMKLSVDLSPYKSVDEVLNLDDAALVSFAEATEQKYFEEIRKRVDSFADANNLDIQEDFSTFLKYARRKTLQDIQNKYGKRTSIKSDKINFNVHALSENFKKKLNDPCGGFDAIKKTVIDSAKSWKRSDYLAPYMAVIQSSGTGKSRIITELGKHTWMFYACLRREGSTGYPLRTPHILPYLDGRIKSEDPFQKYSLLTTEFSDILIFLSYFAGSIRMLRMELSDWKGSFSEHIHSWHERQLDEKVNEAFWEKLATDVDGVLIGSLESARTPNDILSVISVAGEQLHYETKMLRQTVKESGYLDSGFNQLPVLFAFDEASYLLGESADENKRSKFQSLRYALALIPDAAPNGLNFFSIIMDTMGHLMNFAPVRENDPSFRFAASKRLYQPFTDMRNWNVGVLFNSEVAFSSQKDKAVYLLQTGRYLWRTLNLADPELQVDRAIDVAKYKLTNTSEDGQLSALSRPSRSQSLAVLCARFGFNLLPSSRLSMEMSHSYLASCLWLSQSKDLMYSGYPSEPIVALAAQKLMSNSARYPGFSHAILYDELYSVLSHGFIEAGRKGEIVVPLILAYAFDQATESVTTPYLGVSLEQFFQCLFKEHAYRELERSLQTEYKDVWTLAKTGVVNFSQFAEFEYTPNMEQMNDLSNFCLCGVGKPRQPGIDLFGSLRFKNQASMIGISVKNAEQDPNGYHRTAALKSSAYFSKIANVKKQKPDILGMVEENIALPYVVLSFNTAQSASPSLNVYPFDEASAKNQFESFLKKKKKSEKKDPLLPNHIWKSESNSYHLVKPSSKQIVIGLTGLDSSILNIPDDLMFILRKLASTKSTARKLRSLDPDPSLDQILGLTSVAAQNEPVDSNDA